MHGVLSVVWSDACGSVHSLWINTETQEYRHTEFKNGSSSHKDTGTDIGNDKLKARPNHTINPLSYFIEELDTPDEAPFTKLNKKITKLEKKFDKLEKRLDKLESAIESCDKIYSKKIKAITKEFSNLFDDVFDMASAIAEENDIDKNSTCVNEDVQCRTKNNVNHNTEKTTSSKSSDEKRNGYSNSKSNNKEK